MKKSVLSGINIQYPISRMILNGDKVIETRTYQIPSKHLGCDLAFVETPGKKGAFKARVVGIIRFSSCFKYASKKEFRDDIKRHCVEPGTIWDWSDEKPQWGWAIESLKVFEDPYSLNKRPGIVFTNDVPIEYC